MINLMIIYNVVNIFFMKNHKSSRKLEDLVQRRKRRRYHYTWV